MCQILLVVKLENKQDRRTIEETLAERRAKKMRETAEQLNSAPLANDNQELDA